MYLVSLIFSICIINSCKLDGPRQSKSKSVDGTLTDIATLWAPGACVEWRSIPFDKRICESIKEGRFEKGTNTWTCRFFCDPHNACVSPFQSTPDLSAAVVKVESWAMAPANAAWTAGTRGVKGYEVLKQIMPAVTKMVLAWEPYLDNIQTLSTTENGYTQGLCVANHIFAGIYRKSVRSSKLPE